MRSPTLARGALTALAAYCLVLGALAAFAPRTFFEDFPFFAHWVELLPPYNEHLVTDVGGLYLGFAVLFAWAAWRPERQLVLAASTSFLVVSLVHLVFHVTHLEGFGTVDGAAEIATLTAVPVIVAVAIWAAWAPKPPH